MNLAVGPQMNVSGHLDLNPLEVTLSDDTLKVKTQASVSNGVLNLDNGKAINASPKLNVTVQMPMKEPAKLNYEGHVDLSGGQVKGFPFSPFNNINVSADFKTDALDIQSLSLNVLDTDLKASGSVTNFTKPLVNITAECERINLAKLKDVVPELMNQYGLEISGEAGFKVKFEGAALDPLNAKIKATAGLSGVNVASSKFNQKVTDISGSIEATPDSLSWKDFKGVYLGKNYTLTGQLTDFKNPKVTTSLDGDDVQLKADIAKNGDQVTINTLTGKYLTIGFGASGSANLPPGKQPVLDIKSNVTFNIEDILPLLPPDQKKMVEGLNPMGALTIQSTLKGPAQDWKSWDLNATLTSPVVSVMNYKLNNLNVALTQNEGKVKNLTVDGAFYAGTVHAVSSVDLNVPAMPFDLALNINEVDMHQLKMDSPLKSEEVNGKFYLTTIGNGNLNDIKNLHAKGSFAIREGFLTEFKIFKGLLGILNEALTLGQVMITDVEANFVIDDQKMSTDNLRLKSPTIVLLGEGWVDFDQNCDLKMVVDMTSGVVPPIAEEVLRSLQVHIYDKISNPKFDKKISVQKVLNSILKSIF